jgi:hypothetical protein
MNMRRNAVLLALVLAVAGCDDDNGNPNGPSNQPNTIVFTAALSAANEVPPVTNADTNGRGTGTFTLNLTRDGAGTITGATGTFVYSLTGFPAGTNIILTHIHRGAAGINGGVIINTGLSAASPLTLADGTLTNQTFANRPVDPVSLAQEIIDNPAGFYFNVHSTLNPGGAVRAQLVRQ